MSSDKSVSVVLAGYNESANIDMCMEKIYGALSDNFSDWELILIDDASKDDTGERMARFSEKYPNTRCAPNYANLNFGASVLRGLLMAKKDYIVYNACDLPLSPKDMVRVVSNMNPDTDVLVLERMGYKTTKWRRITSDVNKILLKILYPWLTKDTPVLNFVQVYKRSALKEIVPLARSPIFVWPEMVFRAKIKKLNVENVQVQCSIKEARSGAFGHPHDIIWGMYEMFRFRVRLWMGNI